MFTLTDSNIEAKFNTEVSLTKAENDFNNTHASHKAYTKTILESLQTELLNIGFDGFQVTKYAIPANERIGKNTRQVTTVITNPANGKKVAIDTWRNGIYLMGDAKKAITMTLRIRELQKYHNCAVVCISTEVDSGWNWEDYNFKEWHKAIYGDNNFFLMQKTGDGVVFQDFVRRVISLLM